MGRRVRDKKKRSVEGKERTAERISGNHPSRIQAAGGTERERWDGRMWDGWRDRVDGVLRVGEISRRRIMKY